MTNRRSPLHSQKIVRLIVEDRNGQTGSAGRWRGSFTRALTKDERFRCGMRELLPSAAEMTGEILVDDKSELIAKVATDQSFYEGLHAHIKHARNDANTLLEIIESAEGRLSVALEAVDAAATKRGAPVDF